MPKSVLPTPAVLPQVPGSRQPISRVRFYRIGMFGSVGTVARGFCVRNELRLNVWRREKKKKRRRNFVSVSDGKPNRLSAILLFCIF